MDQKSRPAQKIVEILRQNIMILLWKMYRTLTLCSAPAALPPPALPPPAFRADAPHRTSGAHIPALDGQAATQLPAKPVGAAGPDTPERPASNNKLQPGARAAADSPTPAPPAPPAPSPLFPSHTAYQAHAHAAAALPDFRHTNHETRTEPPEPPAAPLDLHASRPAHPPPGAGAAQPPSGAAQPPRVPHSQPHPVMPGHDVRNAPHPSAPSSLPSRAPPAAPATVPSCLPSQALPGRPASPPAPACRPYPAPAIGSSHANSSMSSSIHNHSISYQSQSSLQKHSVQSVYASRPPHLAPFSVANHISNHIQPSTAMQPTATHLSHPINSHSIMNHTSHLPMHNSNSLASSTPNHIGPPLSLVSTATSTLPSYTPSLKHPGLGLPPHAGPFAPPAPMHAPAHHMDVSPTSSAPAIVTTTIHSNSHPNNHPMAPPVVDSRQPPVVDSRQSSLADSRHPPAMDSKQPPVVDSRQPPVSSSELPARSEGLAVSTLASNGFPPPAVYSGSNYPPLYAPYATTLQHSPYLPPAAASPRNTSDTRTSLSASPLVAPKTPKGVRPHTPGSTGAAGAHAPLAYSPRGHSPGRERESFSSNISSLSRSTPASAASAPISAAVMQPPLAPPLTVSLAGPLGAPLAAPLVAPLGACLSAPLAAPTPTPAAPGAPHLAHSLAPVPTVPSISSSAKPPAHWGVTRPSAPERQAGFAPAPPLFGAPLAPPNPNPFSAESLFQSSPGADLLRRELDNRFLAAAGAAGVGGSVPASVRTEMHHHQHQHTHVHQHPAHHPQPATHHPPPPTHHPHHHQLLMPHQPLFKDVGKMTSLYRTGLGLGYPYSSSLLHPAAPYVPPAPPLATYAPKKTGKWNAMHVRIAWEIYNHQQKEKSGGASGGVVGGVGGVPGAGADKDKLRAFPAPAPPPPYRSPYELPPAPYLPHHPHLGVSPFARYGAGAFPGAPTAFGLSAYGRELALQSSLHGVHHAPPLGLHDAWRVRPPAPVAAAAAEARREHEERERARRERDERERRERDERERRKQRDREIERARARSPLRNGAPEQPKEERKEPPRPPPPMAAYPPPWDPYRAFDPLQHMRFAPLVEAAIRAEEDRAKMLSAYAHHQQLKSSPLMHRPLPPHGPLPPLGAHPHQHPHPHAHAHAHTSLAQLPPLAPPLAPLAPLDLLKKEEPR